MNKSKRFFYKNCDKNLLIMITVYLIFLALLIYFWPSIQFKNDCIEKIETGHAKLHFKEALIK